MVTMKHIHAEIKKLLAERDAALDSLSKVECHPQLMDALRDRLFQFYDQPIKRLEERFAVAEYWQNRIANAEHAPNSPAADVTDDSLQG